MLGRYSSNAIPIVFDRLRFLREPLGLLLDRESAKSILLEPISLQGGYEIVGQLQGQIQGRSQIRDRTLRMSPNEGKDLLLLLVKLGAPLGGDHSGRGSRLGMIAHLPLTCG